VVAAVVHFLVVLMAVVHFFVVVVVHFLIFDLDDVVQ
jgi:hypothetical protein